MLLLTKVLSALIYPLNLFFAATIAAVLMRLIGWRRASFAVLVLALAGLWVISTPIFAKWAFWQLERLHPPIALADIPAADVAILLGGVTDPPLAPRQKADLEAGADRIVHAADLYRAGKVRSIIVSGGAMPWTPAGHKEADIMAGFLEDWGVPRQAILVEPDSRTTYENPARLADLRRRNGFRSALLVTSASHMPRALGVYRKMGLPVEPSSSDVEVTWPASRSVLDWMPASAALELSTRATHEFAGFLVYRWRGQL